MSSIHATAACMNWSSRGGRIQKRSSRTARDDTVADDCGIEAVLEHVERRVLVDSARLPSPRLRSANASRVRIISGRSTETPTGAPTAWSSSRRL